MIDAITSVLLPIVEWCHSLSGNWWIAILMFTAITKVLLMPLSLWSHRNSITMVELMPDLFGLKTRFYGDRETIEEKQNELYKERHYHPLLSLVPLAVQIIILFGLSGVIRTIAHSGGSDVALMGIVPSEEGLPYLPVVPLLAGLSSLVQGLAANHINPLQREQSRLEKATTNGISISLSLFLAAFVTCGMAFYWICSNLMAIVVQLACNAIIRPAKFIDYDALEAARSEFEELESSTKPVRKWYERDPHARRERADYRRFFSIEGKHLVFYSEGSGFYKYFKGAIEWLLANSNIQIHYITNDPNDQVFGIAEHEPRLLPYYISQNRLITLMMKMDADVVAMSTPELDNAYIKRSYVRKDIDYVYMPHHTTSFHLTGTMHGYDHFDEVFCVGPHQAAELARMEELNGAHKKRLPLIGYGLIDEEIRDFEQGDHQGTHMPPVVLIAPSWNPGNILDSCIDEMLDVLLARGYRIIVRPHPEYTKRFRPKWDALIARYAQIPESTLLFEKDFSSNSSILEADTIITDWSTVNLEFSFTTLKPSIFIDTPMKVNNPDWEKLEIMPTDISIRNEIGRSLSPENLSELPDLIDDMLSNGPTWAQTVSEVRSRMIANLGYGAEKAGERLLEIVLSKQDASRKDAKAADAHDSAPKHARRPAHAASQDGKHFRSDIACMLLAVLVTVLLVPRPALAYVDPSVMTYAIQAIAAVAVALSAVLGVAFRKTRSAIFKVLHIDENANRMVEPPVKRIDPGMKDQVDADTVFNRANDLILFKKRQVKVAWPFRLILSLLAVALPIFTIFVVAPIELVANNASSLVYGVDVVWAPIVRIALVATLAIALMVSFIKGKPFHVLLALFAAFGLAAYLESLFFARYLPLADGTPVVWSDYAQTMALSAAMWVIVLVGAVVFAFKKPSAARSAALVISAALIIIQVVGIASLRDVSGAGTSVIDTEEEVEVSPEDYENVCTELGLFDVSKNKNVVVFVLDMTDSAYIRTLLDGYYPQILDGLEGFTFYENSGGGMVPTRYGLPFLLTGSTPSPDQALEDYIQWRYPSSSFLPDVSSLGYSIGIYSTGMSFWKEEAYLPASYTINNRDISEAKTSLSANFNERGAVEILYRCGLYRHLPWLFKAPFWYYTDDINQSMTIVHTEQVPDDEVVWQTDDARYYEKLEKRGLVFNEEDASFRFIHLNGTHWPYTLSRTSRRLSSAATWQEQCIGAFNIVKTYLEELKRLGIYEETTVVITADHGIWYPVDSDELEPIDRPTSAIMFVKPAQSAAEAAEPCQISQAPVTVADLLPTMLEAMGADEEMLSSYGTDVYAWNEGDERLRYFYMLDREVDEEGNFGDDGGLWEYVIDGDASDFENWQFTGNICASDDGYYEERGLVEYNAEFANSESYEL